MPLHLVPLPSLPTALETAELLFTYVFRYFEISEDIFSNHGHQFASRVWASFMEKLGVTIRLTSGLYPQFNVQME